jgi:hypothetical protein
MAASYRSGSYSGLGASKQANKQAQKSHAKVPLNIKHIYGSRFSFCIILGLNNLIISKKWQKCMYIYILIFIIGRGESTLVPKKQNLMLICPLKCCKKDIQKLSQTVIKVENDFFPSRSCE